MALIWMLLVKTAKVLQRWNRWLWPCLSLAQNAVGRSMNEQLRGMQGFDPESVSTMPQKSTYPLFHDSTTCLNIPSSTCLWNNPFNHHCFSVSLSMCQPFAGAVAPATLDPLGFPPFAASPCSHCSEFAWHWPGPPGEANKYRTERKTFGHS